MKRIEKKELKVNMNITSIKTLGELKKSVEEAILEGVIENRYDAAKQFLIDKLEANSNEFILVSHGVGKYGRCLGEIFLSPGSDCINDLLITEGHAKVYHGGKR